MRRIITFVLTLTLILSFAGCSKKESVDADVTTTEEIKEAIEATEEEATTEEEKAAEEICLKVGNHYYGDEDAPYDDFYNYFAASCDTVEMVENESYKPLSVAIESFSKYNLKSFLSECNNMVESAREYYDPDDSYSTSSNMYEYIVPSRVDKKVVSLRLDTSSYGGGAHGYYATTGITFDSETGKELTLSDLGNVIDELEDYICNYIENSEYKDEVYPEYKTTVHDDLNGDYTGWYMTGDKLVVVFNPYEIAAYASGQISIDIPLSELKGLESGYMKDAAESYELGSDAPYEIGDNKVAIDIDYDEEYSYIMHGKITVNGKKAIDIADGEYFYSYKHFHYKAADGNDYIVVTTSSDNDYRSSELYKVDGDKVTLLDKIEGGGFTNINESSFYSSDRIDILGTYSCERRYKIANDKFTPVDEMYVIEDISPEYRKYRTIVAKKDVKARLEENGELKESTLKKGTSFLLTYTDAESKVGFETTDGVKGEFDITLEKEGYGVKINGEDQNDLFDNLPFAG